LLKLSTFKVDCTPPVGYPIGLGTQDPATSIRDPLFMRGFVLDDGRTRVLVASLDYMGLMNSAHDALLAALSDAIDTPVERVVVHCVHQHDSVLPNLELDEYLGKETFPAHWWSDVCKTCASAAKTSLAGFREIDAVGHREVRLQGYASNRRILGDDGKVRGMRFSRCASADLVSQPVGVIDPMLRTLAFQGCDGEVLASMSFYATHPQVANGRGMYSADAPGEAMRLLEDSGGMHAYFSGAFGNVTGGKYTSYDDLEGNLLAFGRRLADGVTRNLAAMEWSPAVDIDWQVERFPFPRRELDREEAAAAARDESRPDGERLVKATLLSCISHPGNETYTLKSLGLGAIQALFVPGEPFVEYQLYTQAVAPDRFIAMAANCGDEFVYLPTAEAFAQEGYEVTSFRWCTEEFEPRFRKAIAGLLGSA
jgi:hypothetical protein